MKWKRGEPDGAERSLAALEARCEQHRLAHGSGNETRAMPSITIRNFDDDRSYRR